MVLYRTSATDFTAIIILRFFMDIIMIYPLRHPCCSSTTTIFFRRSKVSTPTINRVILYVCKVCTRVDIFWNEPPRASLVHFYFLVSFEPCFLVFILSQTIIQRVSNACNRMIPQNDFENNPRYYTVHVLANSTARHTQPLDALGSNNPKLIICWDLYKMLFDRKNQFEKQL